MKEFNVFDPTKQQIPKAEDSQAEIKRRQEEYLKLLAERLRGKSIFVATPMYGGQCCGSYTSSCINLGILCAKYGIPLNFKFIFNESLVQRARNFLTEEFFRSEYTHLLFIDADIGFDPRDAIHLVSLCGVQEKGKSKYDVIAGAYAKKDIAWEKVYDAVKSGFGDNDPSSLRKYTSDFAINVLEEKEGEGKGFMINEPLEVSETGTGFMCITREVIDRFRKKYPDKKYIPDHARTKGFDGSKPVYAIFDCVIDPVSKRYLSEDYLFCQQARQLGFHVWICPWMSISHTGSYVFSGSIADIASIPRPLNLSGISPHHNEKVIQSINKK